MKKVVVSSIILLVLSCLAGVMMSVWLGADNEDVFSLTFFILLAVPMIVPCCTVCYTGGCVCGHGVCTTARLNFSLISIVHFFVMLATIFAVLFFTAIPTTAALPYGIIFITFVPFPIALFVSVAEVVNTAFWKPAIVYILEAIVVFSFFMWVMPLPMEMVI